MALIEFFYRGDPENISRFVREFTKQRLFHRGPAWATTFFARKFTKH